MQCLQVTLPVCPMSGITLSTPQTAEKAAMAAGEVPAELAVQAGPGASVRQIHTLLPSIHAIRAFPAAMAAQAEMVARAAVEAAAVAVFPLGFMRTARDL
jgi:hypothetical protein